MKDLFSIAQPVWLRGREQEYNCRVQFKTVCPKAQAQIHIATSGVYQLYVNGTFVAYGPARAGKGHFRQDRIDISPFLTRENNAVVIEVAGYYCTSYCMLQQPSFLQVEIVSADAVLAATGRDFSARKNPRYYQKIQRYSFQRTFAESYTVTAPTDSFFVDESKGNEEVAVTEPKTVIERKTPYPRYETCAAQPLFGGSVSRKIPEKYEYDRYCLQVGFREGQRTGWKLGELECIPEKDWQELVCVPDSETLSAVISAGRYNTYSFHHNATGMIAFTAICEAPVTLYLAFDEILDGGRVNPRRLRCCNVIRYHLSAGCHELRTFEVYTMKYLQVSVLGGSCRVEDLHISEYKHPPVEVPQYDDGVLQEIVDAAVETYRQNAVDLFTDCPSRERAGWLCDSFFMGRTEYALTGENTVEESFLENFLHEDIYGKVPAGMFPMCYPADHPYGRHIPNWAMWLVVELQDYGRRTGKRQLIDLFRDKVYGLLVYLGGFENEDGLLEDVKSWVFVEWSRANEPDMVQGVNYPTNMMYYATLKAAAALYGDSVLDRRAEAVKQAINAQSFDGKFYVDRAVRTPGGLFPVPESTEVCQYYAFFSGVATAQSRPQLLKTLVEEFGPDRNMMYTYPEVHKAAPFIGNYLRLEMLKENGYDRVVLDNIKGYFLYMARTTGTLWEKAETSASCNHGFASSVLYWLKNMQL